MATAALVAKPLKEWYVGSEPVRRVEKAELADWLRRIGEQSMMDDMDDDSHLDALWDDMRYRNSRLVAARSSRRCTKPGAAGRVFGCSEGNSEACSSREG